MPTIAQRSFAGGVISADLFGRSDLVKYNTGLATCENFIVRKSGSVQTRPGSQYLATLSGVTKLVRFVYNKSQSYILAFRAGYVNVYRNGVAVASNIVSPYTGTDFLDLQYVQSADILYLVHPSYQPRKLSRVSDTSWVFSLFAIGASVSAPTGLSAGTPLSVPTCTISGAGTDEYTVTAENETPGSESAETSVLVGGTQIQLTAVSSGATLYNVYRGGHWLASFGAIADPNTIDIPATWATNSRVPATVVVTGAYTYVVTAVATSDASESAASAEVLSSNTSTVLNWSAVTGAASYNIYRKLDGVFGFIGNTTGLTFTDSNIAPDTSISPPETENFFATDGYPSAIGFVQQRIVFAGFSNAPERLRASRTGLYGDFSTHTPIRDDDAISISLVGRDVQRIKHVIEQGSVLVLTSSGEWSLNGNADGVITPTSINAKLQSNHGSADLTPIVASGISVYKIDQGPEIRELQFEFASQSFKGADLSVFAQDIFEGKTIVSWSYASVPNGIIWCVLDDGTAAALTYLPEHQVYGWSTVVTDGEYQDVCCLPETTADATYFVVLRDGVYTLERAYDFSNSASLDNYTQLDSTVAYSGLLATTAALINVTGWTSADTQKIGTSSAVFSAGDVGKYFDLVAGADTLRVKCIAYVGTDQITVRSQRNVPEAFKLVEVDAIYRTANSVSGLTHLNGKTVTLLADNDVYTSVVTAGVASFDRPARIIYAGLPFTCTMQTLDTDPNASQTITTKNKTVDEVSIHVRNSRGLWFAVNDEDYIEYPTRQFEDYGTTPSLVTTKQVAKVVGTWRDTVSISIQQRDPFPLHVLAVAYELTVGG